MVNELTGVKVTYGYDEFSNLVWANQDSRQFVFLYRSVDDVGNLYETKDKKDRVYGAGSRLLETKDAKFSYDEEGNLVEKVEPNGDTWQYEYYGNGMMAKVMKPDKTEVTFKYDALGRRIEKCSEGRATYFVWDGNTILHEYVSQDDSKTLENASKTDDLDSLVTWVFNDGFVPSAKITGEGNYSIISDYLGTPVEAYDEQGHKVWSAELDVYGRVKECTGEKDFIPFRYQGQYEDVEIGLYYNRFRYYDPEQGNYTQVDPIGLAGGNPTLYGYVSNPNLQLDPLGLMAFWKELKHNGMGHHTVPRSHANKHGFPNLGMKKASPSWFPYTIEGSDELHKQFHDALKEQGIPFNRPFNGSSADLIYKTNEAYKNFPQKGFVMIPSTGELIAENVTVREGFHEAMKWDAKKNSGGCK